MKWAFAVANVLSLFFCALGPPLVLSHETLSTTVLFEREIVRILDKHCVMCHVENGPSFPLVTYEETWLKSRPIRAAVLSRHMPPWSAIAGYGDFANDNSLTLRETQFVVSWVEGLGPRNAGTVFANIADSNARPRIPIRAHVDFGHWQLGNPTQELRLRANTIEAGQGDFVKRAVIELGNDSELRIRGLEYMPGDRRVVRAVSFTVEQTGQWIGSWTPWYGFTRLPAGAAIRLAAGSRIVAEIHYRGAKERVVDQGTLGLFFGDTPVRYPVTSLTLEATGKAGKLRDEARLTADTRLLALNPEFSNGLKSIEVSARKPDGGTEILLFAKDLHADWPTPYIFREPVLLKRGTVLSVTAYYATVTNAAFRLTVSRY